MVPSILRLESLDPRARGTLVLRIRGDVDSCDRPGLDRLLPLVSWGDRLHVDVGGLGAFGAELLGWLVRVRARATLVGVPATLGSVPARLARILHLTGLGGLFPRTAVPLDAAEDPDAVYASAR